MLVYDWVEGELLGGPAAKRQLESSAHQRFRRLPAHDIVRALDTVYALHRELEQRGWVAVDFYDSCLIYDFDASAMHVVDLDMYHQGPYVNDMGRAFGSSRFMAPEEYELGATIDMRTTVHTLGRAALVFLSDGTPARLPFRGQDALYAAVAKACEPSPTARFQSVAAFLLGLAKRYRGELRQAQPSSAGPNCPLTTSSPPGILFIVNSES